MFEGIPTPQQENDNVLYRRAVGRANMYLCGHPEQTQAAVANVTQAIALEEDNWDGFVSNLASYKLFYDIYSICPTSIQQELITATSKALNAYIDPDSMLEDIATLESGQNQGTLNYAGRLVFNLARKGIVLDGEKKELPNKISESIIISLKNNNFPFSNRAVNSEEMIDRLVYLLGDKDIDGVAFQILDRDGVFGKCPGAHNLTNQIFRGWGEGIKTIEFEQFDDFLTFSNRSKNKRTIVNPLISFWQEFQAAGEMNPAYFYDRDLNPEERLKAGYNTPRWYGLHVLQYMAGVKADFDITNPANAEHYRNTLANQFEELTPTQINQNIAKFAKALKAVRSIPAEYRNVEAASSWKPAQYIGVNYLKKYGFTTSEAGDWFNLNPVMALDNLLNGPFNEDSQELIRLRNIRRLTRSLDVPNLPLENTRLTEVANCVIKRNDILKVVGPTIRRCLSCGLAKGCRRETAQSNLEEEIITRTIQGL